MSLDREVLRRAVGGVLWNATNYPRKAQPYLLGTDTAPLTGKVVDAVLAALSPQPGVGVAEWEYAVADPAHDFAYMVIAGKPTPGAKAMRRRPAGPWIEVQS